MWGGCGSLVLVLIASLNSREDKHKAPAHPLRRPLSLQLVSISREDKHKAPAHPLRHPLSLQLVSITRY
jgi:hypothetical protein